ncbi:MAG: hypothetical protein GYA36_22175 [Veillonellaceae bacterium]|nr:hypothetical protein [Veillonellaceae bacterium]
MKKIITLLIAISLFEMLFVVTPKDTSGIFYIPTAEPEEWYWDNVGVTGEIIPMYTITTVPREWYQLKADGLKIDGPAKICRPYRAGRFGWVGEIFQLVDGAWVKLPTTAAWVADAEGKFTVCAQAPAAGTYALFGYWVKPADYVEPQVFEVIIRVE